MGRPEYLYVRPGHEYKPEENFLLELWFVLTIYLILKRSHYRI